MILQVVIAVLTGFIRIGLSALYLMVLWIRRTILLVCTPALRSQLNHSLQTADVSRLLGHWSNNLLDTDKVLQSFFNGCAAAGPDGCAFYAATPEAVAQKLDDVIAAIKLNPVPVRTGVSYGLLDYKRLLNAIFRTFYSPYATFPTLAQGLADLAEGNGTVLYQMFESPFFECACNATVDTTLISDGQDAVMCTDGNLNRLTVQESREHYENLLKTSRWGELWAGIRVRCANWPEQPKRHFQGPFVGNTSHPVLWVGNTADPVTPLAFAHKMAKGFPGSAVLTQDSPGHCSISGPSICTQKYIRSYFLNGTLPPPGVVCPAVSEPLPPRSRNQGQDDAQAVLARDLTEEDASILNAVQELIRSPIVSPLGRGF
ncbi:hypothetical protein HGRIS_006007 [Hohenbuehelia grisea]|uniref:Peptidase S33 tripeptidyl aminopeptidase-like C-terminal domain-containing protein n=1 Tax=Hohenbuehelia grisea TaxID=104357 RepID=A0ABR3K0S7_9AGAR